MKYKKILAMILSAVTIVNSTIPAFATESQTMVATYEEEVKTEEYETTVVANEYIASGFIENDKGGISWSIDSNGHLLLSGKGDYGVTMDKPWEQYRQNIKTAKVTLTNITDCSYMFYECSSLTNIDLSGLDTSQVTSMDGMFWGCRSLKNIDLSGFNTSNVVYMSGMFRGCSSLKELKLSSFNTSRAMDMARIFENCSSLEKIDLSGFDTSQVVYMDQMFSWCSSLKELDLSRFDTSKATSMGEMFNWCSSLKELNLSGFDTSQVTDMFGMFQQCHSLISLDISGFRTDKVRFIGNLFSGCSMLKELDLSTFDLAMLSNGDYALRGCDELQRIKVPLNISDGIIIKLEGNWYSLDGTKWSHLPQRLEKSIFLQKGSVPTDDSDAENPNPEEPNMGTVKENIVIEGLEIQEIGRAYGRIPLKDAIGKVWKGQKAYYRYDTAGSDLSDYIEIKSDAEGYINIPTKLYSYANGANTEFSDKVYLRMSTQIGDIENPDGIDTIDLPYTVTLKGKITPVSFSQSWELGASGSISGTAGAEVGIGIGAAEAQIGLAGVGLELGGSGKLSVENSYENGNRTLTLFQEYGMELIGTAEAGPTGSLAVMGQDLTLKPIKVSGNAKTSSTNGMGLKITNYSPTNENQVKQIGKFILSYLAVLKGNIFLLCALGDDYSNQFVTKENLCLSADADLVKLEYSDVSAEYGASLEGEALRSYSEKYDYDINSKEKEFELVRSLSTGSSEGLKDVEINIFSQGIEGGMKLNATQINDELDSITIGKQLESDEAYLFFEKETGKKNFEVTYSGENAEQLCKDFEKINKFEQGKIRYFFFNGPCKMYEDIDGTSIVGAYVETEEKAKLHSVGLDFSAALGLGVDVKTKLEGTGCYKYVTETGSYVCGNKQKNYEANSELGNIVESQRMEIEELLTEPLDTMKSVIEKCLQEEAARIDEVVSNAGAFVKGKLEEAKDWLVHLVTINKSEISRTSFQSFAISTMSLEEEEAPGVALTVGDPYIVYVTDANGNEVTDYSECPLELTLSYNDEMLKAAKTNASNAKNLGIYMHVDEKAGYVYVGGTVDEANQQVTAEITKPGQYILAIDTLAPGIVDFNVSDSSSTPTINVSFDEKSAFSEFSMTLDGKEIVNNDNWEGYYNGSLRRISYPVKTELADGEHEVSVYAVDSAGNAMQQAAVFKFTVDTKLPELNKLTVSVDEKILRVRAWSEHMDVADAVAKIQWTNANEETVTEEYVMDIMDGYYTVMCKPENDALFATVSVVTTDINGNKAETEEIIKNLENPEINSANDLWIRFVDGTGATRSEYEYTGAAIKPKVQIYEGTDLLKEKTDYTISFKNNVKAGTATIVVKSKGNYQGQETANFTILPKDIAAEDVIADDIVVVSNGKQQLKVPVIKFGKLKLTNKKDKDFSVIWPDTAEGAYKDVGTYVIRVTGNGNYTGERDIQLLIGGKTVNKLSVSKIPTQTYTGSAIEIPNLVVKDGKKELINGTDYMISYKDNVGIGTAKLIITGIGGYYVGTKEISFKIQGISLSKVKVDAASLPKSVIYNGEEQTPELRLYYQANKKAEIVELVKDTDYKVTYQKNVNAGNAQILLEGIGKYSGTMKKSFKITPFDAKVNENEKITIELEDAFVYAKGGVKPEPVVKFDDHVLRLGQDYTLTYANNKTVTTEKTKKLPVVTVKFKGNFKGSLLENFEITVQSLEDLTISLKDKVYSKKKNAWKSSPVITDLDGKVLKLGTDYEKLISYYTDAACTTEVGSEIPEAGTDIWVKAEGKGNYAGSCIVGKYRIAASSITKAKVKFEKQYYTGKAIEPDYKDITSVIVNKQELVAGVDYEIVENSYQKNIKVGTATMQIKGKGNYGDVLTVKYTIQKKNFIWRWFEGLF